MADVRLGLAILLPAVEASLPCFDARRLAGHVFLKRHRAIAGPDAAGTAEVRDAGFGTDSRAGENHDFVTLTNSRSEIFELHNKITYRTAGAPLTTEN